MPSRNTPWNVSKNILHRGFVVEKCVSFLCFCNRLPQTWLLNATTIYSLTVLECRSPNSVSVCEIKVCRHTSTVSECSRGKPVSCCFRFWWLPACLEHSTDSCIFGRTVFSSACVKSPSAFFLRIRVIAFRVQPYHPG